MYLNKMQYKAVNEMFRLWQCTVGWCEESKIGKCQFPQAVLGAHLIPDLETSYFLDLTDPNFCEFDKTYIIGVG